MHRHVVVLVVAVSGALCPAARGQGDVAATASGAPALRRPVDLVAVEGRVFAANQRTGTVSVVDAKSRRVVSEVPVGQRLSGLAVTPDRRWLLVTDEGRHELALLRIDAAQLTLVDRIAVPHSPVSVAVAADGRTCTVASLWARQLAFVDFDASQPTKDRPARLVRRGTLDLPFAPRAQIAAAGRLIVADAFGGRLAVVDPAARKLVGELSIAGHHLRGLALHGPFPEKNGDTTRPELLVTHQVLSSQTSTTHEHVFWGGVVGNRMRAIDLDLLAAAKRDDPAPGSIDVLGRPGSAAGDPGGIAVTPGGATVIALSGIDEVAIRRSPHDIFTQRPVGRRPTAVALGPDGREAYVANTLDDSISVVRLDDAGATATISLGPPAKLALADRGERLFYDARLSLDGWYSCHSCHSDGHTNGLLNDNLGDEYYGAPKKVLSLLGTADTSPWAWNGGAPSLEAQLGKSLRVTMQADEEKVTDAAIQALKAYLATLRPPPGIDVARGTVDEAAVRRGRATFAGSGCADCHAPATYTTPGVFDVGLRDERGLKEFNPPSLRGVSQRTPYFHDNRAADLRDVLVKHRHGLKEPLPAGDLEDLLRFLRSL